MGNSQRWEFMIKGNNSHLVYVINMVINIVKQVEYVLIRV